MNCIYSIPMTIAPLVSKSLASSRVVSILVNPSAAACKGCCTCSASTWGGSPLPWGGSSAGLVSTCGISGQLMFCYNISWPLNLKYMYIWIYYIHLCIYVHYYIIYIIFSYYRISKLILTSYTYHWVVRFCSMYLACVYYPSLSIWTGCNCRSF